MTDRPEDPWWDKFPDNLDQAPCEICGLAPCSNPAFCSSAREADHRAQLTAHNGSSKKSWRDGLVTAAELQTKQFKPVRIILPDLIPEGVTILAGKPKVGKSWFALDVCMAVADPIRFVLGDKKPVHGNVLYLPLEDNERRLKERIDKISQGQTRWSERLQIRTEWNRFDQGGLEDIEAWAKSVENPRLIWIDTLPKVRPVASKRSEAAYDADYRAIEGLQKLIGQHPGLGAVLNCHLRKAPSEDDPFDEVSGTLGLTAAADTIIVLKKHSGMVKLYVRGRDIEEGEFAAEFNRASCRWRIVGTAEEAFRSRERNEILAALQDAGRDQDGKPVAMSVSQLMAATERTDRNALDQMLYKMRKAGEIEVAGRGSYCLPSDYPLNPGKNGKKGGSEPIAEHQPIDSTTVSATTNLTDESYRNLTGSETGKKPVRNERSSKPLADNSNSPNLTDLTDLTRVESSGSAADPRDPGPFPEFLRREVSPDKRPALGPDGDSLDDLK